MPPARPFSERLQLCDEQFVLLRRENLGAAGDGGLRSGLSARCLKSQELAAIPVAQEVLPAARSSP